MEPERRLLSGSGWTLIAYAATRGVIFAATLVLARLLEPSEIGSVAIALLVVSTFTILTSLGLGDAVIIAPRDTPLLRTIFTLLLAGGLLGSVVVALAASTVGTLIGSESLGPVLAALAAMIVIGAASAFYGGLLERELQFRARFRTQVVQAITYAIVAVSAAVAGAGVWSLVAGQLTSAIALLIALFVKAPYRPSPGLFRGRVRQALAISRGFFAHGVLGHVHHNFDVGAVAIVDGTRMAGFYSMSFALASVPYNAFTHSVATAAFPAIAARHRRGDSATGAGLDLLAVATLFACPVGLLLSATADPLVTLMLGDKWAPAVGAVTVLGLWAAVIQVEGALGWFLNSTGKAGANAAISAALTIPLLPALFLGAQLDGIRGVAWVMVLNAVVTSIALMLYSHQNAGLPLRRQIFPLEGVVIGGAVAWGCARLTIVLTGGAPDAFSVALAAVIGFGTYLAAIRVLRPATLALGIEFIRDSIEGIRRGDEPPPEIATADLVEPLDG